MLTKSNSIFVLYSDELDRLTPDNITRHPNSPTQNGSDSILSFYAVLYSGRTLSRSILASIFAAKQEEIFSLDSVLENQEDTVPPSERPVPNAQQDENRVAIALINFPVRKVSKCEKINEISEKNTFILGVFKNVIFNSKINLRKQEDSKLNSLYKKTPCSIQRRIF